MNRTRNILVPIELGPQAELVLDYAVALATKLDAKLHLLHVAGRPLAESAGSVAATATTREDSLEQCQQELELLAAARANQAPFGPTMLRVGDETRVILRTANEVHADLVVMGTHGQRRGVSRLLLGSVAESVARGGHCPVLVL
ncbi:MAG: universal stress protein, partial [Kofleriaceae bacterium]